MPELQCATCTDQQKVERGCTQDAVIPVTLMGEDNWRCIRRPVLDQPHEFLYWLKMYHNFKQGFLPEPGSLMDQCALVLDVFYILDATYGKIEEFKAEERERKTRGPNSDYGRPPGGVSSRG